MFVQFLLIFLIVAVASWLAAFGSRFFAYWTGVINKPHRLRDIHKKPTPLLGGLGIGIIIMGAVIVGLWSGWFQARDLQPLQMIGFLIAIFIILLGGYLDDRFDLPAHWQFLFPFFASVVVILTGTHILQVTSLAGHGAWSLTWSRLIIPFGSGTWTFLFPSDFLTLIWLLAVTYAMKFLDGLDGLVTGQTVIGAGLIAALALSHAYYQPVVALLALIVAAAFLGFLPSNMHPAKQFLGESGSVLAGFSLGFLSIVAGTKVATALMAIGLPLADASLVLVGRMFRGVSPFRGDDTHLHFKLLKAGLSQRWVVFTLWLIALGFGVVALGLQTRGKLLLLVGLLVLTLLLSYFSSLMRRSRISKV